MMFRYHTFNIKIIMNRIDEEVMNDVQDTSENLSACVSSNRNRKYKSETSHLNKSIDDTPGSEIKYHSSANKMNL